MQYSTSIPFHGDQTKAMEFAVGVLSALGFRVVSRQPATVEFEGPGMTSTKQNPLLGATRFVLSGDDQQLVAEADLGGVRWMAWFVFLFPIGLNVALFVMLTLGFQIAMPQAMDRVVPITAMVAAANVLFWMVGAPVLIRSLRRRSCRAIDALVSSLASIGDEAS